MANILIIHGSSQTNALAMETLLEGRSDTVTLAADTSIPGDVSSYDAILFSDSAANTAATLLSSTKGMVFVGNGEWVAYGLATAVSAGAGQTQIDVKSTSHDIAVDAGLNSLGLVTVNAAGGTAHRINPASMASGGVQIADDSTSTDNRIVLFAFESGAALTSGNAAGRRVGWGHIDPSLWDVQGQAIFFAAVDWAIGEPAEDTATVSPEAGSVIAVGLAPLVNDFTTIVLRGTLINEAGSPLADLTNLSCLVWYNTAPAGAPDESLSSLTTNSNGSYSFALAIGGLAFGEQVYRVIYREDPPTANNCRVHSPNYE